jgi:hypothetical protein
MRRSDQPLATALLLALATTGAAGQQFYPDDPLAREPEPLRVEEAKFRKLNDYFDLFMHTFGKPGEPVREGGPPPRARSINTIDEVPDSRGWFVNRIGVRPLSVEEIVRGPGNDRPPAEGSWKIVAAKTEGVTPGFRIQDATGQRYLLKFDPATNPEMATAADVIGSLLFHALGYYVPQNYLVEFDERRLDIAEGATMPDAVGNARPITATDVAHALLRVPRSAGGRIRAVASRYLAGRPLGEYRYFGTRRDDPNDIVPHEHRRELRGLHVFCAWLNHNDSRAINDLDMLVEEDGLRFVRHHLIDFGAILGSASVTSDTARDGNAYFWEGRRSLAQIATLGLLVPRWARARYQRSRAVGMVNDDAFDPDEWKPNYPNPAFDRRRPDDEFWAAKKVMAFTDEQLAAVVAAARYSRAEDTALVTRYLIERRNRIGRKYFAKVLPLDRFRVEGGRLAWDDLGVAHGFDPPREVSVAWQRFDNATGARTPLAGRSGPTLPPEIADAPPGTYVAARLQAGEAAKAVDLVLRQQGGSVTVVGVERHWGR